MPTAMCILHTQTTHKQHTNNAEQHSCTSTQQHSSTAYKATTQSYNSRSTAQSATPQNRNAGTPRHIKTITTIKAKHGGQHTEDRSGAKHPLVPESTATSETNLSEFLVGRMNREQWIEEHPDMEELCTFPLCGKSLTGVTDKVVSQMCPDVNYCSKECRRRDANENNHRSMALLIKYRKQELEKKRCESQRSQTIRCSHRPPMRSIEYHGLPTSPSHGTLLTRILSAENSRRLRGRRVSCNFSLKSSQTQK